jgi:hypothetical protein
MGRSKWGWIATTVLEAVLALLVFGLFAAASGCASVPSADTFSVPAPVHTVTEKRVFVPIPASLTAHGDIAPGHKPSEAVQIAAQRKADLLVCYGQLDEVRRINATVVGPTQ